MQKFRDLELEAIRRIVFEVDRVPVEARARILDYVRDRTKEPELNLEPLYPVGAAAMPITPMEQEFEPEAVEE